MAKRLSRQDVIKAARAMKSHSTTRGEPHIVVGQPSVTERALALVREFVGDIEAAYGDAQSLDAEWYDLARTYEKAVAFLKDVRS